MCISTWDYLLYFCRSSRVDQILIPTFVTCKNTLFAICTIYYEKAQWLERKGNQWSKDEDQQFSYVPWKFTAVITIQIGYYWICGKILLHFYIRTMKKSWWEIIGELLEIAEAKLHEVKKVKDFQEVDDVGHCYGAMAFITNILMFALVHQL